MEYIVGTEEMYRYDKYTSEVLGVPECVLMERAALGVFDELTENINKYLTANKPVLLMCGTGNNGGDGLALGRLLCLKGIPVEIIIIGNSDKCSESNLLQQKILSSYEIEVKKYTVQQALDYFEGLSNSHGFSTVVDALFGIGLSRELSAEYDGILEIVNSFRANRVALDIPSGINADGVFYSKNPFNADVTYTFGFKKAGQLIFPSAEYCGFVKLIDMGIDEKSITGELPVLCRPTDTKDFELPVRSRGANKGTYKKLLIIAGSKDISGAILLAIGSALASGIGMIMVLTHKDNKGVISSKYPEVMLKVYDETMQKQELENAFVQAEKWADGILIGPGIGTDAIAENLVKLAVEATDKPIVMDADALNVLSCNSKSLTNINTNGRKMIMTPHLKELSRLSMISVSEIKTRLIALSRQLAEAWNVILITKDATSIVSTRQDTYSYLIDSGNEGMATAGSGDVLSGLAAVLMLQMEDAFEAAAAAAYIHGMAGTLMAGENSGTRALSASDLIMGIKRVWMDLDDGGIAKVYSIFK